MCRPAACQETAGGGRGPSPCCAASRKRLAAARSGNSHAEPLWYRPVTATSALRSVWIVEEVKPTPPAAPRSRRAVRVTCAVPSERNVSVHSRREPMWTTPTSKAWPNPRTPSSATHGGNPSAAASAVRQMSPLTMQMPVRIVPATGAARFGPTTAPTRATTSATTRTTAMYSGAAWPDVRARERSTPAVAGTTGDLAPVSAEHPTSVPDEAGTGVRRA